VNTACVGEENKSPGANGKEKTCSSQEKESKKINVCWKLDLIMLP